MLASSFDQPVADTAQAHLAAIVESSDDAILSKDLDGFILSWNQAAEQLFGYKAEEIIGKHISTLAVPDRLAEFPNILARIARGDRIEHYSTQQRARDGRVIWMSLTVSPIRDSSGAIIGASSIARSIEDQNRYAELQARLAAIVESSDDAIISKDLNGVIQSWNTGAERLFRYRAEEIIGKHISTLAVPDRLEEFPNILARIARGDRIDHYETQRRTKDGRAVSISLTVSPIRDASGRISGASKVARDITLQRQYQQALSDANESLSRAYADLEQFAYSASHDLQEPLRMVSAYSEMLRWKFGDQLGPAADKYIGYIVEGASRMEQMLRDVLAFTHASQTRNVVIEKVNAKDALVRSLCSLRTAIDESNASITYGPLPVVAVHQYRLEQLFQNLIGNAIRYRSEKPPEIHISAVRRNNQWEFSVQDNGIGIHPQYKEQIFGIFERLHSVSDYPGTGMGLAICQRVVECAGGRIWVESEPGRGSTFLFTIPSGPE